MRCLKPQRLNPSTRSKLHVDPKLNPEPETLTQARNLNLKPKSLHPQTPNLFIIGVFDLGPFQFYPRFGRARSTRKHGTPKP